MLLERKSNELSKKKKQLRWFSIPSIINIFNSNHRKDLQKSIDELGNEVKSIQIEIKSNFRRKLEIVELLNQSESLQTKYYLNLLQIAKDVEYEKNDEFEYEIRQRKHLLSAEPQGEKALILLDEIIDAGWEMKEKYFMNSVGAGVLSIGFNGKDPIDLIDELKPILHKYLKSIDQLDMQSFTQYDRIPSDISGFKFYILDGIIFDSIRLESMEKRLNKFTFIQKRVESTLLVLREIKNENELKLDILANEIESKANLN